MSKPIPPYLPFRDAMSRGYVERIERRQYLNWVKGLRCCGCNAPADDPHHLYSRGFKGMGTKVPDFWTIPMCRPCHDELHHDVDAWEEKHGSQWEHIALTLLQAVREERLSFD